VRALEQLLDPTLVLKRDLEAVMEGQASVKPLVKKKRKKGDEPPTHIVIGDLQVKPGVCTRNIDWIGSFIHDEFADRENVAVNQLGDFGDFPSLSSWDRGKREMEGRRFVADVNCFNECFARLDALIPHKKSWRYDIEFGNHEDRVTRAASEMPQLEGLISLELLDTKAWSRHDFKTVVEIDGVYYSHFFHPVMSARPYSGSNVELRLQKIGKSFVMGHQQGLLHGVRNVMGRLQHGLVLGASYAHSEDYLGFQGNNHWRGIAILHQVEDGDYDPQFVSLDYLARRYEGMRLVDFLEKYES
jgi:hypothetical protein